MNLLTFRACILTFFVLVVVFFCSYSSLCARYEIFELGMQYSGFGYQADFTRKMVEKSIPFYLDSEGTLKYSSKNKNEVETITKELDARPVIHFKKKKYANLFILLLQKQKVDFVIRYGKDLNDIHIVYDERYANVVDKIMNNDFQQAILKSKSTGVLGAFLVETP